MKVLNDLFDDFFNESVIDDLRTAPFSFATDPALEDKSDSGFLHLSLQDGKVESFISSKLNVYAELILKKIISMNPELSDYYPRRFNWNYYNKSSSGTWHPDTLEPNHISIVYNLNTNDGGTYIGDKFVKSEAGRAIIFKSNIEHRGVGPTEDAQRYMLNIVLMKENNQ